MVQTRSTTTRSTRSKTYKINFDTTTKLNKNTKKEKPEPAVAIRRRSTRIVKPAQDNFNIALYGRDENGKRNEFHGWSGDPYQRDFNGWESPSLEERVEEAIEDKKIKKELKKCEIGLAGYAIDDFIINEEYEDDYDYSDEDSLSSDADSDEDSEDSDEEVVEYWYEDSDDE